MKLSEVGLTLLQARHQPFPAISEFLLGMFAQLPSNFVLADVTAQDRLNLIGERLMPLLGVGQLFERLGSLQDFLFVRDAGFGVQ